MTTHDEMALVAEGFLNLARDLRVATRKLHGNAGNVEAVFDIIESINHAAETMRAYYRRPIQ